MKEFFMGMLQKKRFTRRFIAVMLSVIAMGFAVSLLVLVDMGTDPCSSFNIAMANRLGMSVGTWQVLFYAVLLVAVLMLGRQEIGIGTIANMFLVGYSLQFFSWLWRKILSPGTLDSMAVRIAVLIPALLLFVAAVAVYIDVELGTSPYDAIPNIIAKRQKRLPFRLVRICYDLFFVVLAYLLGAHIGGVTVLLGFLFGPAITYVGKKIAPFFEIEDKSFL